MSAKYGDWTRGEDEALLKKIGGTDEARLILKDQKVIHVRWPSEVLAPEILKKYEMVVRYEDPPKLPSNFASLKLGRPVHAFATVAKVIDGDDVSRRAEHYGCRLRVCDGILMLENSQFYPEEWKRYSFPLVGTVLEKKGRLYYMNLSYFPAYSGYWAIQPLPINNNDGWNPGTIVFFDLR